MLRSFIVVSAVVAVVSGCGELEASVRSPSEETLAEGQGGAYVKVSRLSTSGVQRLVISASPGGYSRELLYDANSGAFSGFIVLPAGTYLLTAKAFQGDAGVGLGSASVTISSGGSAAVSLRVIDTAPSEGQVDIAPIIQNFTVSKLVVNQNEAVIVTADVVDLDGDAITGKWTDDCGGKFASTTTASTTWSRGNVGSCLLKYEATAKGASVSESAWVQVVTAASGSVSISGQFVPRPRISGLQASWYRGDAGWAYASFDRAWGGANLKNVAPGAGVDFGVSYGSDQSVTSVKMSDSCSGAWPGDAGSSGSYRRWFAPRVMDGGVACKVTATISNGELDDSFSIGVEVR